MPYDLFISYSRRDNAQGRITQLVERIKTDFAAFAGRPLVPFFDATEIRGMEDWRHRILQGLRESRLLLACLSPAYLQSEYCEWEFNEYLKHEIGRAYFGDGVAPIYFVQVPGWEDKGFEQRCAAWVAELRRRQHFDLRPWFRAGEESLRDAAVLERMRQLNAQLKERITRGERAEHSLGNVDAHNPHFIGRTAELRRLRETVALSKVGVLTAVHGLGGVGKTALAIEYAHAFAHEYGGGRWQVRCEGKEDLRAAIAELAAPLALEFNEDEKKNIDRQYQRVLAELRRLVDSHEPHRCLLLLDNVDRSRLLEPAQSQRLPAEEWLHVIATTRLGENDLHGKQKDRVFLPVDELPEADAVEVIETYQPNSAFPNDAEREAARDIVNLLGRFTLAIETAAVFLGQFSNDVTCAGFLARLKKEGLGALDTAAELASQGVRHAEKRLTATLAPTLERLTDPEKLALSYAALLPADHIALPWIRALIAQEFPVIGRDSEPGYPDPWKNLLRRLLSLRLLQVTNVMNDDGQPLVVRIHRLLQEVTNRWEAARLEDRTAAVIRHWKARARIAWEEHLRLSIGETLAWEARVLLETSHFLCIAGKELPLAFFSAGRMSIVLARHNEALEYYSLGIHEGLSEAAPSCSGRAAIVNEMHCLSGVAQTELDSLSHKWAMDLLSCAERVPTKVRTPPTAMPKALIVTGMMDENQGSSRQISEILHSVLSCYAGKVIAGGINLGLHGCVGDVAYELGLKGKKQFSLVGYLPMQLAVQTRSDRRYDRLHTVGPPRFGLASASRDARYDRLSKYDVMGFSPEQPLQFWSDLLDEGVHPDQVECLAFGGGVFVAVELRIALALGAKVMVFGGTGGAADDVLEDSLWAGVPNLISVPLDASRLHGVFKWISLDSGQQ